MALALIIATDSSVMPLTRPSYASVAASRGMQAGSKGVDEQRDELEDLIRVEVRVIPAIGVRANDLDAVGEHHRRQVAAVAQRQREKVHRPVASLNGPAWSSSVRQSLPSVSGDRPPAASSSPFMTRIVVDRYHGKPTRRPSTTLASRAPAT